MKLYTEEQLREAIELAREKYQSDMMLSTNGIMLQFTPIEVPTTEEIHKMATNYSNLYYEYRAGAEWVVEQLKQEKQ